MTPRSTGPTRSKRSCGLLAYRRAISGALEVLLVHPGGPFWAKKDAGAWTIPKGEPSEGESSEACARREFEEETGWQVGPGPLLALGSIRQKAGKLVEAWAFEADYDVTTLRSNRFEIEWPPRSGTSRSFPEIDRAEYFGVEAARAKLNPAQIALLDRLLELAGGDRAGATP